MDEDRYFDGFVGGMDVRDVGPPPADPYAMPAELTGAIRTAREAVTALREQLGKALPGLRLGAVGLLPGAVGEIVALACGCADTVAEEDEARNRDVYALAGLARLATLPWAGPSGDALAAAYPSGPSGAGAP